MTRDAIYGACIARQAYDHIKAGRGAPEPDDMELFAEDAEAIADLWEEVVSTDEPDDVTDRVLCAAIWFLLDDTKVPVHQADRDTGFLLCGLRHHAILEASRLAGVPRYTKSVQGFLTLKNRFLTRGQAMKLARANGQVSASSTARELFSEDLY